MFASFNFWLSIAFFWPFYLLLRRFVTLRNVGLLVLSIIFLACLSKAYVLVVLASVLVTYFLALQLSKQRSRVLLCVGIIFHIGMLIVLKYHTALSLDVFSAESFGAHSLKEVFIPLGISFTSLAAVGYVIDVYKGQAPVRNILTFSLFYTFFPKIVSGPIERASMLVPQFERPAIVDSAAIRRGLFLIVWGSVQKFCIADNVSFFADRAFSGIIPLSTFTALLATFAFSLQIYADFSGYSDIAKGIAHLFGFDLSWNFKLPWFSRSPQDFWRRWHISLSEWFRDYVYIPLGGSRKGLIRTCINLCITMALVGLWHSAAWTFLAWGLYQGALLSMQRIAKETRGGFHYVAKFFSGPLSHVLFLPSMFFGWALFRSPTFSIFRNIWFLGGESDIKGAELHRLVLLIVLFSLSILLMDLYRAYKKDLYGFANANSAVQLGFYLVAFYALIFLSPVITAPFVYAGF